MNDLGEGDNLTSMERDFASGRPTAFCEPHSVLPPTQRESSHNGSTSTSSCSERGMFHLRIGLLPFCFSLVCCVLFCAVWLLPVVMAVSPRRNRPAHCAADVVKGRPH